MIILGNTLVSEDLLEKHFICDLGKCKGACCVEGDFGAPLLAEEIPVIEQHLDHIKPYLVPEALDAIANKGVWEKDCDGDLVTTCLPTGECNFSYRENGILSCGIEKAWKEGKIDFQKPVSCHLYPIRISDVGQYEALNYHRWDVCKPACKLGDEHKLPVYRFLKGALVRKYGTDWYNELDEIAQCMEE